MTRYLPDFAGVFCLVLFLISLGAIRNHLFIDGDSFWHLKAGSVMLEQGQLIDHDIFSHTAYGTPWTAHEWLSEIIMAAVHKLAGLEGLICFFLFIVALTFWLLFKITERHANDLVAVCSVALAFLLGKMHLAARPHLFTWLFMVVTLALLTSGGKRLFWLPVIMVFWVNLHGGFVLGLVLQAVFIIGSFIDGQQRETRPLREALNRQKRPACILILSILLVGLNPFGYALLLFPFQVSDGVFALFINEWKAPDLQSMWYLRLYLVVLFLLFASGKSTWTERLLCVFFLNAALTHIRHFGLLVMAMAPFSARAITDVIYAIRGPRVSSLQEQQLPLSKFSGPALMTAIAWALILAGAVSSSILAPLSPREMLKVETPQLNQLVSFLAANRPDGNMFNEYSLGGYLLYALDPPPKVFIDGRADMYGQKLLTDYHDIMTSSTKRNALLEKYAIDWVVFEKDSDLNKDLKDSGTWHSAYANTYYEVLLREGKTRLD